MSKIASLIREDDKFTSWLQALNYEFKYYCYVLKKLTDNLNDTEEIGEIMPWIKKLFSNQYQVQSLKEIRNRYLVFLTISLINKEIFPIFKFLPPNGPLESIENITVVKSRPAEWEVDPTWTDICISVQNAIKPMKCSIHEDFMKCQEIVEINKVLDEEFQFMIHIAVPLLSKWPQSKDRTKASNWIQLLCIVHYNCFCTNMRVIRNDYLMALLGYLYDCKLNGPFKMNPPDDTLHPLQKMAMDYVHEIQSNILKPESQLVNEFLLDQPPPKDGGAFCFIAMTGQIINGQRHSISKCSNMTSV